MQKINVLFVCLGNICRSPTAHGVFQQLVDDSGLTDYFDIDSAGTSGWHIGKKPDSRTMVAAKKRGYDLSGLRGRQVDVDDFEKYDYILAMDESNLQDLQALQPSHYSGVLTLFLNYFPESSHNEVPDPYYGGDKGFDMVLDLVEAASQGLLTTIRNEKNL